MKPKPQTAARKPVSQVDTAVRRHVLLPYNPLRARNRNGERLLQRTAVAVA